MFNTFNLKSAIKSIGLEKPGGRSVCALLQNFILFRLYGESIFRSFFRARVLILSGRIAIIAFIRMSRLTGANFCMPPLYPSVMWWQIKGVNRHFGPRCIIFDDTLIQKSNSGCEGCTKVHDHVAHKTVYGMKVLTCAYFDETTTTVTDFSIHRELDKSMQQSSLIDHLCTDSYILCYRIRKDKSILHYASGMGTPHMRISIL